MKVRAEDLLTPCERKVARCLSRDVTFKEAAGELGISINTVKSHSARIYIKLGVNSRMGMITALLASKKHDLPSLVCPV